MRKICFRAWDTEKKKMVYHFHLHEDFAYTLEYNSKGYQTRFIPIQFTGLLDKNGKEIYEGYIVNFPTGNTIGDFEYNGEIVFEEGMYMVKNKRYNFYLKPKDCEVIGNKFENPEILK